MNAFSWLKTSIKESILPFLENLMARDAVGRSGSTISYKERELSLTSFESFFCKEFASNAQISPDS